MIRTIEQAEKERFDNLPLHEQIFHDLIKYRRVVRYKLKKWPNIKQLNKKIESQFPAGITLHWSFSSGETTDTFYYHAWVSVNRFYISQFKDVYFHYSGQLVKQYWKVSDGRRPTEKWAVPEGTIRPAALHELKKHRNHIHGNIKWQSFFGTREYERFSHLIWR